MVVATTLATTLATASACTCATPASGNRDPHKHRNHAHHGSMQMHSPSHIVGGYNLPQGQDPKLKNYYDMLEKNRQKSIEKY